MKDLVIIYGDNPVLMRAAGEALPAKLSRSNRNLRYYNRPVLNVKDKQNVARLILISSDKYADGLAEKIAADYVEAHGEDFDVKHIDSSKVKDALGELQQAKVKPDAPTAEDLTKVKGIGKKTAALLQENGITTIAELAALDDKMQELEAVDGLGNIEYLVKAAEEHQ